MAIILVALFPAGIAESAPATTVTEHDVLPILLRRCSNCHGAAYQEGELDLRSRASILGGGESGPAIELGHPERSLLIKKIREGEMPPEESHGRAGIEVPTESDIAILSEWIAAGAPETPAPTPPETAEEVSDHWAFRSPQKPPVPKPLKGKTRHRHPIDAFLSSELDAAGLAFSPPADPLTLLRRATFDLTGLPPTPEEVSDFVGVALRGSKSEERAYKRAINRLLRSPRYGERWGRAWLDIAGYADSEGKRNADMIRPHAWRYRDYVINSFNDDKPYDRFLLEQIAGDELADYAGAAALTPELYTNLVATGFLRMAPDGTTANPVNRPEDRLEVMADELRVLAEGVMGLTIDCARCHDHKYDPISQRDYYGLMAVFKGAYDEYDWLTPQEFNNQWDKAQRRHLDLALPEDQHQWKNEVAAIDAEIASHKEEIATLSANAEGNAKKKGLENKIKELEKTKPQAPKIRALWDRGRPSHTYVLERGDHLKPAALVSPGVPEVLAPGLAPFKVERPWPGASQTGRRLAFARWLTQPDHPLTARVIVNRVWKQHFGRGIVSSLENFGTLGTPPTHPELLDWLAVSFVEKGWSLKWLHRLIMTSTAYRQSSTVTPDHAERDPENLLLARMPLRRMDAEEVRDTILSISGRLDETMFGPPDGVDVRDDGMVTSQFSTEDDSLRRSVYVRHRRKQMPTILETFDLPQMNPNCIQRKNSTIVTQPLHLLNNAMIHDLANHFADRISEEAPGEDAARVEQAWLLALGRPPTAEETRSSIETLGSLEEEWRIALAEDGGTSEKSPTQLALAGFCHTLINSAAFLYID